MNYEKLKLETWSRFEHYKFYQYADQPWFNICCTVNASLLYTYCKRNKLSFLHAYMYLTQLAVNSSEPFKYRVVDGEVRVYRDIAISIAVTGDDEMLRFCELNHILSFSDFTQHAKTIEEEVKARPFTAIAPFENKIRQDVIHMSVLPWFDFTSFSNARITNTLNSIPKVVFGKLNEKEGQMLMPLSVEVHHGMMDGLHVSRFVEKLQGMFDNPKLLVTTGN